MPTYPLPFIVNFRIGKRGRWFGAPRDNNRLHAGCDLFAKEGTDIYAVENGYVIEIKANFYHGRGEFVLKLDSGHIVRYCEIKGVIKGIKKGSHVTEGDKIAEVGKMFYDSMLHFEMYKGNLDGPLTIRSNPKYQRRDDLMDPSGYLDHCILRSKRAW